MKIRKIWDISNNVIGSELRYCSGCKKKVLFTDSLVKRHNANGKNIYQFAIYKCSNGHSWNKVLDKYHSDNSGEKSEFKSREENPYSKEITKTNRLIVKEIITEESEFEIYSNNNRVRLDKLIFERIKGVSRSKIQTLIKHGFILVNNQNVKSKYRVKSKDIILIKDEVI